jgi:hypothetical protein
VREPFGEAAFQVRVRCPRLGVCAKPFPERQVLAPLFASVAYSMCMRDPASARVLQEEDQPALLACVALILIAKPNPVRPPATLHGR